MRTVTAFTGALLLALAAVFLVPDAAVHAVPHLDASAFDVGVPSLASALVLVRFKSAFSLSGTDYEAGKQYRLAQATADSVVNLGLAERVSEPANARTVTAQDGAVITLNDDQFNRLFGEPTEEEVAAELDRMSEADAEDRAAAGANRQRAARNPADQLVPDTARAAATAALQRGYGVGHADHWSRRTVRYFDALATGKDSQEESVRMVAQLRRTAGSLPDEQLRAEETEANATIERAAAAGWISDGQAKRLRAFLEVGEFTRLHTTSTADVPKAGYLLPKPFLAEVFVIVEQYGFARRYFRAVPMTGPGNELDLKNVAGKPAVGWVGEGANFPITDVVFGEGKLTVAKLAAITSWTTELEEDQAIALLPIVAELFAEAFGEAEDKAGLIGDGSAAYGGNVGVLNLPNAQVVTLGAGLTTGAGFGETAARAADDRLSLARRTGAMWAMHRSFRNLLARLENGAGYRIFQETITGQAPDTLLGYPIAYSEVLPSVDEVAAGDRFAALGRFSRTLMGQKRQITADISREAVLQDDQGDIVYNAFQADGALLRISERVGYQTPDAVQSAYVVLRAAAA